MQSLSIKTLDIIIGLLFLICLSFGLAYIGVRQVFPNQDISKPFMIMGAIFSVLSIGLFIYMYNKFFVTAKPQIESTIHVTNKIEQTLQWVDHQSSFDTKPDKKYLITVLSFFIFLAIFIYSIIHWVL